MSETLRNETAERVRLYLAKHTIPLTGENPSQLLDEALDIERAAGAAEAIGVLRRLRRYSKLSIRTADAAEAEAAADALLARTKES